MTSLIKKFKNLRKYNIRTKRPQSWKKLMRQSKEVKQNMTGSRNIEICSGVILSSYGQSLISERETEH